MPGRARNWFGRENLREASCIFFVPGNWCTPDLVTQDLGAVWPSRVLQATRPHPHPSFFHRGHQLLETPRIPPCAPTRWRCAQRHPGLCQLSRGTWRVSGHPLCRSPIPSRPWALSSSLVEEGTLTHPQCTQAFSLTRHTYSQTPSPAHTDPECP